MGPVAQRNLRGRLAAPGQRPGRRETQREPMPGLCAARCQARVLGQTPWEGGREGKRSVWEIGVRDKGNLDQ